MIGRRQLASSVRSFLSLRQGQLFVADTAPSLMKKALQAPDRRFSLATIRKPPRGFNAREKYIK
jgi:hypothetical protein